MSDNAILAALARLEVGQEQLDSRLAKLEAGQAQFGSRLAKLEAGQDSLRAETTRLRVDLMARMDQHSTMLTAMRDDIAVNLGSGGCG